MRVNIHHFVVTSVLIHAVLFAAWISTPSQQLLIPAAQSSAPTLHVAIMNPQRLPQKQVSVHKPVHQKVHHIDKPKPVPLPQIARTSKPRPAMSEPPAQAPGATPEQSAYAARLRRDELRNRVLSRIRSDLQQYFVYPMLAQRHGWQGKVLLAFSIGRNGMIHDIRVASGSGYAILDNSAVNALARVHNLYQSDDNLQGQTMNLQLPVIFQLQGG